MRLPGGDRGDSGGGRAKVAMTKVGAEARRAGHKSGAACPSGKSGSGALAMAPAAT